MPAPLVMIAKVAAQSAVKKVDKEFPGGVVALVGIIIAVSLIVQVSIIAGIFAAVGSSSAGATTDCGTKNIAPVGSLSNAGIPPVAMAAYQQAGAATGIDWAYLAGIGKVESQHGSYGGAHLEPNGDVVPHIIGPALDGTGGNEAIPATALGILFDGDPVWDHAVGPMQFLPTTWARNGKDGNNDGVSDPHNYFDAILATAFYLKASGAPENMQQAIFAYNHAQWYVDKVVAQAAEYRTSSTPSAGGAAGAAAPVSQPLNPTTPVVASGGWVQPMVTGTYTLTSRFGYRSNPTGEGVQFHKGLDYAAKEGTPINAIGAGTVQHAFYSSSFGNVVYIDHGAGIVSIYGHMFETPSVVTGQQVSAGTHIGGVGTTGDSTGDHVHLQIEREGVAVDPETFLAGAGVPDAGGVVAGPTCATTELTGQTGAVGGNGQGAAWGGYTNGAIPVTALCSIPFQPTQHLRCDAASALDQLNTNFAAKFGHNMDVLVSYRDYADQVACASRHVAGCTAPGTNNQGWAMAVGLGSNIDQFDSPEHIWMSQNAGASGWVLPSWAERTSTTPNPGHWQFGSFQ